ncbi:excinuclease ABC subunit A [Pasteurella skyensis]|uniref:Excinuclease ABC subunit A n=1 Tax=Phocoenobacter skyensis TaxID=97481 RepID=A0AAJ6P2T4_9PAST|nr:excinuclease ABC subunit A [Pasteurella skyensis]MDP8170050.1 excinuclease ABC subunit A [Pasteurella skyensis]MDP8175079.1 excinuclease ABC subunit A [Pasteurella skyensis]
MKLSTKLLTIGLAAILLSACSARNDTVYFSIQDTLNSPEAKSVLNPSIKLYFARSASGKVLKSGLVSNKKTNAVGKSDEKACRWAFLSAVKQFQQTAASMGARKVTNLVSYYKRNTYKSRSKFECHAGNMMSGVALKGNIVK